MGITKSIVNPVLKLTAATEKVSKGDLSSRADITTNDEIGELATSFNKMTEDLSTSMEKEKKLVAQAAADAEKKRAVELEKAYKELREKSERLEKFHEVTVDREEDMVRLKEEINALLEKLGQPKKCEEPDKIRDFEKKK